MEFVHDDGGRAEAGYKGYAGDCGTRAVAIATEKPYQEVYAAINEIAKKERPRKRERRSSARNGIYRHTLNKYLESVGWEWVPTMGIGTGCQVHMREDELPSGRIIARVSKHYVAVIDGIIHDVFDCSRGGTRCVYGYWRKTENFGG